MFVSVMPAPAASPRAPIRLPYTPPPRWFRRQLALLSAVAPPLAARIGLRLFGLPPRIKSDEEGRAWLEKGRLETLDVMGLQSLAWRWDPPDGPGPLVLLAHGWGGRAAQMAAFVPLLLSRGHSVLAFDAPAHGRAPGRRSSLLHFGETVLALRRRHGDLHGAIGHSMGATAIAFGMHRGMPLSRAVFLAPMPFPLQILPVFCEFLGAPRSLAPRVQRLLEKRFDVRIADLTLPALTPASPPPLLLIHDDDDAQVPMDLIDATLARWPGRLMRTQGLGHVRILSDAAVMAAAVSFITETSEA